MFIDINKLSDEDKKALEEINMEFNEEYENSIENEIENMYQDYIKFFTK